MRHTLAATLILLVAAAVNAQTTNPFQLVGFSTNEFTGDAGVLQMGAACFAEFGSGARMCTSVEVMETTAFPGQGDPSRAWVRPVPGTSNFDASGTGSSPLELSCNGWSPSGVEFGLTVSATGQFDSLVCSTPRPVACCAPTPIPEPTSSLMQGSGAVLAGLLAKEKATR